ncbi:MAG: hypothetical protein ACPG7F_16775, partial [Aggregatilineales bacterium]
MKQLNCLLITVVLLAIPVISMAQDETPDYLSETALTREAGWAGAGLLAILIITCGVAYAYKQRFGQLPRNIQTAAGNANDNLAKFLDDRVEASAKTTTPVDDMVWIPARLLHQLLADGARNEGILPPDGDPMQARKALYERFDKPIDIPDPAQPDSIATGIGFGGEAI